ncbi:MAG: hypothetical protein AB7T22_11560 [Calditrichaceae bacterium]
MFFTILMILIIVFGIWGLMVWLRKTSWDAVHRNLLDLEDNYDGQVIRRGFASRPIFHGKYNNFGLTVNFSTAKSTDGRMTYIDISYERSGSVSLSISDKKWLESQEAGEMQDFKSITTASGSELIIRPVSGEAVQRLLNKKSFLDLLNNFDNLAYIFIGKSGVITEFMTQEVIKETEFKKMNERIILIDKLIKVVG